MYIKYINKAKKAPPKLKVKKVKGKRKNNTGGKFD